MTTAPDPASDPARRVVQRLSPSQVANRTYAEQVAFTLTVLRDREWKLRPSHVFPESAFLVGYTEIDDHGRILGPDVTACALPAVVNHLPV